MLPYRHTPVECVAWKPFRCTDASEMKRRYILLPVETSCSGILLPHSRPKMAAVSLSPSKASRWSYAHSWCCSISNSLKVCQGKCGETERVRHRWVRNEPSLLLWGLFVCLRVVPVETFEAKVPRSIQNKWDFDSEKAHGCQVTQISLLQGFKHQK